MVKRHWKLIGLVLLIGLMACPLTYEEKDKCGVASQIQQIEKKMWAAAKKMDFPLEKEAEGEIMHQKHKGHKQ